VAAALALAQRLDAMHLLGEIHQIEVDGEGRGGGAGGIVREHGDLGGQVLAGGRIVVPTRLGERSDPLLGLEEGGRLLRPEDVTQDFAEQVNGSRQVHG
jgi:hypothetical protein